MKKQLDCSVLQRGFSLIELSIVLVILGLLIGGIAGMRSYIKNSQLNNLMNESKIYVDAFSQFQTRYNAPPGDYCSTSTTCGTQAANSTSDTWSGALNGDGNGIIRAAATAFPKEQYFAFKHLALAGLIAGSYTGAVNGAGGATAGSNVPAASIDTGAYIYDHPNATDGIVTSDTFYPNGSYGNVLIIAGLYANSALVPSRPLVSAKEAYMIDDKFDDGVSNTGNIVAPKNLTTCSTAGAYLTTSNNSNDKLCNFIVKMQ